MLRAELRTKQVAAELNHEPVKTGLVWYRDLVVQSPPCKGLNRQAYRYLRVSESIFNRGVRRVAINQFAISLREL